MNTSATIKLNRLRRLHLNGRIETIVQDRKRVFVVDNKTGEIIFSKKFIEDIITVRVSGDKNAPDIIQCNISLKSPHGGLLRHSETIILK